MVFNEQAIKTLSEAGLTNLQSKVYLILVERGKSEAKTIAEIARTDRSNSYKAIADLQKMGLVKKQVGSPSLYIAIPAEQGIKLLLRNKSQEYYNIQRTTKKLLKQLRNQVERESEEEDYFIIEPPELLSGEWERKIIDTKESVDLIVLEKREINDMSIFDKYEKLLKRKVRVRWLFDRSKRDDNEFSLRIRQFQKLFMYPNFEVKYSFSPQKAYFGTHDNKSLAVFLESKGTLKNSRTLRTNNPFLVGVFQDLFETEWSQAKKYNLNQIPLNNT